MRHELSDRNLDLGNLTHRDLLTQARCELKSRIQQLKDEKAKDRKGRKFIIFSANKVDSNARDLGDKVVSNINYLQEVVTGSPTLTEYFRRKYNAVPLAQRLPGINKGDTINEAAHPLGEFLSFSPEYGLCREYHSGTKYGPDKLRARIRESDSLIERFARMDQIAIISAFHDGIR